MFLLELTELNHQKLIQFKKLKNFKKKTKPFDKQKGRTFCTLRRLGLQHLKKLN